MKFLWAIVFLGFSIQPAFSDLTPGGPQTPPKYENWQWKGLPAVLAVGEGNCRKEICIGTATNPYKGQSTLAICAPIIGTFESNSNMCPSAPDCLAENTRGVKFSDKPVKVLKLSQPSPRTRETDSQHSNGGN